MVLFSAFLSTWKHLFFELPDGVMLILKHKTPPFPWILAYYTFARGFFGGLCKPDGSSETKSEVFNQTIETMLQAEE